ncbi:MAG TPA: alpha-amylase family glycosyl hydrolase [Trueperaceae bacterium]
MGDLRGVAERLDYLDWLGVTDIWLMPIGPSPSYHGYDPTDYTSIAPEYGTMADFDDLLAQARARGIRVILDLVVNHTSDQHPWFQAAAAGAEEYRDYYLWRDEPPDWRGLGSGSPWHPSGGSYYLALFSGNQPDLNHRNPLVERELEEAVRFWLERGVAGFRVDAIQHIVEGEDGAISNSEANFRWVAKFVEFIESVAPGAYLLGETWTATPLIARYHRDAGLHLSTNYPLWEAILSSVQSRSPANLATVLEQDLRLYPPGSVRAPFISNHDQVRPATLFGFLRPDPERSRLAAALLLSAPGVPIVYYGEELGMPNGEGDDDRMKRTPMRWRAGAGAGFSDSRPWIPFSTEDPTISVDSQREDEASLLNWYRRLIAVRQASPALAGGTLEVLDPPERSILVLRRTHPEETVLVVANFANRGAVLDLRSLGAASATDLLSGQQLGESALLPATSALLLRLPER